MELILETIQMMDNVEYIYLNINSNKITSEGILLFIHAFDNLTQLKYITLNLSDNEFNEISFELLFEYLLEKTNIKIVIILSKHK